MQLDLNVLLADGYKSPSQRARRMTEGWFAGQMYCPACPSPRLEQTRGSNPVVDFLCPDCGATEGGNTRRMCKKVWDRNCPDMKPAFNDKRGRCKQ